MPAAGRPAQTVPPTPGHCKRRGRGDHRDTRPLPDRWSPSLRSVGTLFALLSSALWGTSDFLGGTASRRLPLVGVVAGSEVFGLIGLFAAAIVTGSFGASTGYVEWGLLGAIASSGGILAFYEALATGTMGVVAPIAALGVAVPVIVGIGQGDRPNALQATGVAIAILGVVLASGP